MDHDHAMGFHGQIHICIYRDDRRREMANADYPQGSRGVIYSTLLGADIGPLSWVIYDCFHRWSTLHADKKRGYFFVGPEISIKER